MNDRIYPVNLHVAEEVKRVATLKNSIWPEADKEHYGDGLPDNFFASGKETLVFELDNELIGYLTWTWDLGVAHIDSTAVHPNHRRHGIATKLKQELEARAKAKGCHKIMSETGTDWSSRKLNQNLGYMELLILKNHWGGKDSVLFEKRIA